MLRKKSSLIAQQRTRIVCGHSEGAAWHGSLGAFASTALMGSQTYSPGGPFGYTPGNECCVIQLWRLLKSALSILCFPLANMWGVTWYCTWAWTTYNISKQFPNCFQAKVESQYASNPFLFSLFFFFFFMPRLGNIKVLSKLDPGSLIHWEIAADWIHSVLRLWQAAARVAWVSRWPLTSAVHDDKKNYKAFWGKFEQYMLYWSY